MTSGIHDLEELILRCRNAVAKEHIREAIIAYKGGAYRSCIVATWIAVVFDIIEKLRELELSGDKNAKKRLEALEAIRGKGASGIKDALEFERRILDIARDDFELLTHIEYTDLARLFEDRNRSAHPTFRESGEKYEPSAELARTHVRHAVDILLSREPVQGKAALDRIWTELRSEYFPDNPEDAVTHLSAGPLARPRRGLLRDVIIGLTKAFLIEELPVKKLRQLRSALEAVMRMHQSAGTEVLLADLPAILASVPDDKWVRVFRYFSTITDSWEAAGRAMQIKARQFLGEAKGEHLVRAIHWGLDSPIGGEVATRIDELGSENLKRLVAFGPRREYCGAAADLFAHSGSFGDATDRGLNLLMPLAEWLEARQVEVIAEAFVQNSQVTYAWRVADAVLPHIFSVSARHAGATRPKWVQVHEKLQDDYFKETGAKLRQLLAQQYPELA